MTLARPQRRIWAARTTATLAVLGLLVAAAPAGAIVISNGPTDTPGGGWSCTLPVAGSEKLAGGGNYTCTGTAGSFTNLYLGVDRNTTVPFGDNMDSTGGSEPSGNERFIWSADGATTIRYTGTTSIAGYGAVDTRVTLTFSGTGAVVSDATTQALTGTNIRGAQGVHSLWRIGSAVGSLTVNVLIEASDAGAGVFSPADLYFGSGSTHRRGDGLTEVDRSHVDLAFYTSSCGDSQVDAPEVCDLGTGVNGTGCCTTACQFRTGGTVCRASGGVCDLQESCSGSSGNCPVNGFVSSATTCRSSAGVCDPAENCTGSSAACPSNTLSSSSTPCRASTGVCDPTENCTGSAPACPGDTISSSSTVCRASAGVCDIAENCDGVDVDCPGDTLESSATTCRSVAGVCDVSENCSGLDADCPADGFEASTLECRASGGVCDVAESCTGSGAACPADDFQPSTVECRATVGSCDVAESCTGSTADCPADVVKPSSEVCRATAGVCDVAESCDGASGVCPTDAFEPSSVECRADAGQCDVPENCTGSAADCPAEGFEPDGTSCDDTLTCTISDACVAGACVGDSMTCGDGTVQGACAEECDDGGTDPNDGCSPTCLIEIGLACPETPLSGCKPPFVPGKSTLQLSNKAVNAKDGFKFKWMRGTRTTLAEYGTPLTSTNYQLCLYDQSGLRIEVTHPAGGTCAGKACWKATGFQGFKYSDKELTPDGGQKLGLKQGAVEKAKIQFSGRGANLDLPADLTTLAQPIVVQIHNSDGVCWEAIFSGPPTKQTLEKFQDKAD